MVKSWWFWCCYFLGIQYKLACLSVWPSTPRLQDNSIIFSCFCVLCERAHGLRSLPKGLRYIQQFRFYLILASSSSHFKPEKKKKKRTHSFSVLMSCIHSLISIFSATHCISKHHSDKDDKNDKKKWENATTHRQILVFYTGKSAKTNTEKWNANYFATETTQETNALSKALYRCLSVFLSKEKNERINWKQWQEKDSEK